MHAPAADPGSRDPGAGPRTASQSALRRQTPKATPGGSRGGKGLTQGEQPLGGRGSDTEPKYRVDPNNGCASDDERPKSLIITTTDPREEPGALAAHAGICAGGEEKSSSLPRPWRHVSARKQTCFE